MFCSLVHICNGSRRLKVMQTVAVQRKITMPAGQVIILLMYNAVTCVIAMFVVFLL